MFQENETFSEWKEERVSSKSSYLFSSHFQGKNPDFLISKYLFLMAKVRCENFQVYTKNDDVVANPA